MSADAPELVTFVPVGDNRTAARLGVIEVGEIFPTSAGLGAGPYSYGAAWRVFLPGQAPRFRAAHDIALAKQDLRRAVLAWVDAAGLASATPPQGPIRSFRANAHAAK